MQLPEETIYFDTAGVSKIQLSVVDVITDYYDTHAKKGKEGIKKIRQTSIPLLKKEISKLINSHPKEIAITNNTTEGINILAQGYPWKPGDRILIPDNEYPANVYPWLNLEKKGVIIDFVQTKKGIIYLKDIYESIHENTRALAISHVGYLSGQVIPLDELGEFCENNNLLFFVDVAQSAGVIPIDVVKSKITALSTCGWKWLMAPVGVGFLYCSKSLLSTITPIYTGMDAMVQSKYYQDYPFNYFPDSRKLEYSSLPLSLVVGLCQAISIVNEISVETIFEKTILLVHHLRESIEEIGFQCFSSFVNQSGILSVRHEEVDSHCLHQLLLDNNIHTSLWHGYIRFSPSYLNTKDEIDRIINFLKENVLNLK